MVSSVDGHSPERYRVDSDDLSDDQLESSVDGQRLSEILLVSSVDGHSPERYRVDSDDLSDDQLESSGVALTANA